MQPSPQDTTLGIFLALLCCTGPAVIGFAAGFGWAKRLARLGWPGALVPGIFHKRFEGD